MLLPIYCEVQPFDGKGQENAVVELRVLKGVRHRTQMSGSEQATLGLLGL